MERPNKYDFDFSEDYESNLETYCDELESIISKGDCVSHYEKKIETLEKSLDKAFDVIVELNDCTNLSSEKYGHCPFEKKCGYFSRCISNKENWKEWLMKDE